jgi:hypothetical protein
MPGPLLHVAAAIQCPHTTPVTTQSSNMRVLVSGTPVATVADTFPVAGCPFQVPIPTGTKPQPCVRVQWTVPAARVLVNGTPPLTAVSPGVGVSIEGIPGGPAVVVTVQPRVIAT